MLKIWLFLALFSCSRKEETITEKLIPTPSNIPAPSPEIDKEEGALDTTGKYVLIKTKNKTYHTGLLREDPKHKTYGRVYAKLADCDKLPDEFDLRTLGYVSDIRDQGQCGSCWSFSKTGSLESALRVAGAGTFDLAEQEMVSCDSEQYGCEGGLLSDFKYQINRGQSLESDFPYTSGRTGRNGSCKSGLKPAAKGASFAYIGAAGRSPSEDELKCGLYKFHTVPWITVSASGSWGSPPSSEKTAYNHCSNGQTNHAVGVVGWWKDGRGKTQFIMKNSWGLGWGDKGYMSLPLGCDAFGEEVAFIQVEKVPGPTPTPPGPTPTPGPCILPKAKLPAEVQVFQDTEVMLGVKAEAGVTYSWSIDGKVVGNESMLYVTIAKDSAYKLSAKNSCSTVESSVRIRIVLSQ